MTVTTLTVHSPYQLSADLTAQWRRLCQGLESVPTVDSFLDHWRRQLGPLRGLAETLPAITDSPDQALTFLISSAQTGESFAGRIVVQALLPKLVLIARSQLRADLSMDEALAGTIAGLWELIAEYPLDRRPHAVAANLVMDALKRLRQQLRPDAALGCALRLDATALAQTSAILFEATTRTPDHSAGQDRDELVDVLTRAVELGAIRRSDARLLTRVYRHGQAAECATEMGISPGAVRKRCSTLKANLRPLAAAGQLS